MQIVYGKACCLTILYDNTYTSLPYSAETLKIANLDYKLAATVGDRQRAVTKTYGSEISGCFRTRLTKDCIIPLFKIITDANATFDIYMNRVIEKVVYCNVRICNFDLKADLDSAFYVKIEIANTLDSYVDKSETLFNNLKWHKSNTLFFRDGIFKQNKELIPHVYKFSFKGDYTGVCSYTLKIHSPLIKDSLLSNDDILSNVILFLTNTHTITFTTLQPINDLIETDTCGELLVTRKYQIEDDIVFDFNSDTENWIKKV